jgi:hypothetical protein
MLRDADSGGGRSEGAIRYTMTVAAITQAGGSKALEATLCDGRRWGW